MNLRFNSILFRSFHKSFSFNSLPKSNSFSIFKNPNFFSNKMSTNNNNNSKSCFNCGKVGHMRRDCTNPRSNGNQITPSNRRNQTTNANAKQSASSSSSAGNNKSSNKQPVKVELPTNQNIVPLIDIGVNLTNRRFKQDLPAVLERSKQVGLSHLIITGTSEKASKEGIAFCMKYNKQKDLGIKLVSTVGCHPHDAKSWKFDNDQTLNSFRKLLKSPDVVAVGECGLDFNRMFSPQDVQEKVFEEQIKLAIEVKKPLFLHERDAHDSFIKILNKHKEALKKSDVAVVVHCFTGSLEHVKDYLQFGCYIGLTGFICDSRPGRGDHLGPVAKAIPADKLLIETDAPFITPRNMPRRLSAGGRCEPFHIVYVLNQLAKLRGIAVPSKEFDQLAKQMHENSLKVFQIQTDAQ